MAKALVLSAIWVVLAALGSLLLREAPDSVGELALLVLIGPVVFLAHLALSEGLGAVVDAVQSKFPLVRRISEFVSARNRGPSFSALRIALGVLLGGVLCLLMFVGKGWVQGYL